MPNRKKKRNSGKLPVSAIWNKSRSYANGVFRGLGMLPNKQQTVRRRESGDRAFSASVKTLALLAGF